MNHKLRIHPVDLQDYDGFLAFLEENANEGYEAVRIYRSCSVFRKSDAPPKSYSMAYAPPQEEVPAVPSVPGLKNDVAIFPAKGPDAWRARWPQDLVEHYGEIVPYNLSAVLRSIRYLILPVVLFVAFLLFVKPVTQADAVPAGSSAHTLFPFLLAIFLLVLLNLFVGVFSYAINTIHLRGARQALREGRVYTASASLRTPVTIKNLLVMLDLVPDILLILVCVAAYFSV